MSRSVVVSPARTLRELKSQHLCKCHDAYPPTHSGFSLARSWFTYVRLFYLGERDMTFDPDKLTIKLQFPSDPDLTLTFFDRARRAVGDFPVSAVTMIHRSEHGPALFPCSGPPAPAFGLHFTDMLAAGYTAKC